MNEQTRRLKQQTKVLDAQTTACIARVIYKNKGYWEQITHVSSAALAGYEETERNYSTYESGADA